MYTAGEGGYPELQRLIGAVVSSSALAKQLFHNPMSVKKDVEGICHLSEEEWLLVVTAINTNKCTDVYQLAAALAERIDEIEEEKANTRK